VAQVHGYFTTKYPSHGCRLVNTANMVALTTTGCTIERDPLSQGSGMQAERGATETDAQQPARPTRQPAQQTRRRSAQFRRGAGGTVLQCSSGGEEGCRGTGQQHGNHRNAI